MSYSRRFFQNIIAHGQKAASPALFPETVFNSPVSHVAATFRLEGAAYALVGDEPGWIAALKIAWLWLMEERVKQVLVLGAEEFDPAILDAWQSAGFFRGRKPNAGPIASEGAAAVLVRKAKPGDAKIISQMEDGFVYRTKPQSLAAGRRCLKRLDPQLPCRLSAQRNWMGVIESQLTRERLQKDDGMEAYLGEAATASTAWNTLRALASLDAGCPRLLVPVWGTTHQVGALELEL